MQPNRAQNGGLAGGGDSGERGQSYNISGGQLDTTVTSEGSREGQRRRGDQLPAASKQGHTDMQGESNEGLTDQQIGQIYEKVIAVRGFNFRGAKVPVPSGLCIAAWRQYLADYQDTNLVDFLTYGWPIYCDTTALLTPTPVNHPSARQHDADVRYYIEVERGYGALGGPYDRQPFNYMQLSPLMTKPKKDSDHRRVIMDLSWPPAASINDAIGGIEYVDGPMTIRLPTVEYMEGRILQLGKGAYLYKTDLARGYRQLRVDPSDWPLLGFTHEGKYFFDMCPPFGLRTSALCMQRTSEGISWIHANRGFISRPYLDDFGGAEADKESAEEALNTLQDIMRELGVREAKHKVCRLAHRMIWLGLWYDTIDMTIAIPQEKLGEIMGVLKSWEGRVRASRLEMQQLLGLLQFVASVSPPARIFSNRMLTNLREMPKKGTESLSLGFKSDLRFFLDLLPDYNGIRIVDKAKVPCQEKLELDACLSGCGVYTGDAYYAEAFPEPLQQQKHIIAHLELLNIVVAVKMWGPQWRGHSLEVKCDNMNACLALQSGRSRDSFIQHCVRELFVLTASWDIELRVRHWPGKDMIRADALSRMHADRKCREWVLADSELRRARRVRVPEGAFRLDTRM